MPTHGFAYAKVKNWIFPSWFPGNGIGFGIFSNDFWSSTIWASQIQVSYPEIKNHENPGIQPINRCSCPWCRCEILHKCPLKGVPSIRTSFALCRPPIGSYSFLFTQMKLGENGEKLPLATKFRIRKERKWGRRRGQQRETLTVTPPPQLQIIHQFVQSQKEHLP